MHLVPDPELGKGRHVTSVQFLSETPGSSASLLHPCSTPELAQETGACTQIQGGEEPQGSLNPTLAQLPPPPICPMPAALGLAHCLDVPMASSRPAGRPLPLPGLLSHSRMRHPSGQACSAGRPLCQGYCSHWSHCIASLCYELPDALTLWEVGGMLTSLMRVDS